MIQGKMIAVVMGVYNVPDRGRPGEGVEGGHQSIAMLDEPIDENGTFRGYKNTLITLSARADLTIGAFAEFYQASNFRVYCHFSSSHTRSCKTQIGDERQERQTNWIAVALVDPRQAASTPALGRS